MKLITPKKRRKLTTLELSSPARGALRRLKTGLGMSFTRSVEQGVIWLADSLLPEPMDDATRAKLGLRVETAASLLNSAPARANRKRGGK